MDIQLHEMSVGDILGRGMQLFIKRLPYFYAALLIVELPTLAVSVLSPLVPALGLLNLVFLLVLTPIGSAATLRIVVQEYLDGQVSLGEAFQFALSRFLPLLGTTILNGLLVWLGFIACCLPGIYLSIIWCMMSQVVVVENHSGMEALNRSRTLVRGYFGHVFGLLLLLVLANLAVYLAVNLGLAALLPFQQFPAFGGPAPQQPNPFAGPAITNYGNYVIVTVCTVLVSITLQAYSAVCITLLYFDLRRRKEDYDLPTGFAKIAKWREQSWDEEAEMPASSAAPPTGIKEPGTSLPPSKPPETGIQPPEGGIQPP